MLQLVHGFFYTSPKTIYTSAQRMASCYEVELYTSGEGFAVINDIKYAHRPNNVLISFPGDRRYSIGTFSCHSFKFLANDDHDFVAAISNLKGVNNLPDAEELIPLFQEIYVLSEKTESELYLDSAMRNILSRIHQNYSIAMAKQRNYDDSMEQALCYLTENLDQKLSLTSLAASVCMSPSYFHKRFKQYFNGNSPNKILLKKRIEYAKRLIGDNSLSFERIAEMSGFSSRAYFDVCFKKETGVTPAHFRQQLNALS